MKNTPLIFNAKSMPMYFSSLLVKLRPILPAVSGESSALLGLNEQGRCAALLGLRRAWVNTHAELGSLQARHQRDLNLSFQCLTSAPKAENTAPN